jgi:hypothetical protein
VLQCINGFSSNLVEGRTTICQLKEIIPTLFGLMFRHIYTSISRFSLRNKVKLRLLKLYFYRLRAHINFLKTMYLIYNKFRLYHTRFYPHLKEDIFCYQANIDWLINWCLTKEQWSPFMCGKHLLDIIYICFIWGMISITGVFFSRI